MLSLVKRYLGTRSSAGARRIALAYALFAGIWIFASDYVVSLWSGHDVRMELSQTLKGLLFVATTAVLLFLATRRQLQRLQRESQLREVAEANVIQNERLFRQLFAGNPLPTWVVDRENLQFLEVNDAAQCHYGYSREEFLKLRLPDLQSSGQPKDLSPLQGGSPSSGAVELRHRTKAGEELNVEIWVAELTYRGRAGLLSVVSDITARKRAEAELRASEEKFREIAETIQEVFWVTDPVKRRLIYLSPAYERIWGRSTAQHYENAADWLEAVHPEDRARIAEASARQATQPYDVEYRIIRPDGTVRWIWDHAFPVRDSDGRCIRIIGVAEDITARIASEAERQRLEAQFRQAQKMEAVGQLSAGISHDFNNLLTIIQMQTALLLAEPTRSVDDVPPLQEIERATQRAAELTRQLLAFSRQQKLSRQNVELNDVTARVAKMLRRTVGQNIDLQLDLTPVPLGVNADPGMIEQILVNLVINARDAMPRGGPIKLSSCLAEYKEDSPPSSSGKIGRFACVAIQDSGTGIKPEHLPRIFEPFFTTKDVGKGSGLGLAMVYGIAQQHGGWIDVDTIAGRGTTFRVFIPLGTAETPSAKSDSPVCNPSGNGTILLLEDDDHIRKTVTVYLRHIGYQMIVAADGQEALRKWKQQQEKIDLLLTDIVLPGGMDGREVAERILRDRPTLPVIYTSGYSVHLVQEEMRLVEGENFLVKPFNPQSLGNIIARHLGNDRPSRRLLHEDGRKSGSFAP